MFKCLTKPINHHFRFPTEICHSKLKVGSHLLLLLLYVRCAHTQRHATNTIQARYHNLLCACILARLNTVTCFKFKCTHLCHTLCSDFPKYSLLQSYVIDYIKKN